MVDVFMVGVVTCVILLHNVFFVYLFVSHTARTSKGVVGQAIRGCMIKSFFKL